MRLTATDLSMSLVPAGTHDGIFRVVYRFENEQLLELMNSTAHGAMLSALFETSPHIAFIWVCTFARLARSRQSIWP